jgi:hypothetical protein
MHTGLHALTWTLQRLGIAVGIGVALMVFAYVMVIAVIVVGQAVVAFGE